MVGFGILLLVLGAGSLLLPLIGYQFTLMDLVDDFQPWAGIVVAVIGAVLLFMGMTRREAANEAGSTATVPPAPDQEEPPRQP